MNGYHLCCNITIYYFDPRKKYSSLGENAYKRKVIRKDADLHYRRCCSDNSNEETNLQEKTTYLSDNAKHQNTIEYRIYPDGNLDKKGPPLDCFIASDISLTIEKYDNIISNNSRKIINKPPINEDDKENTALCANIVDESAESSETSPERDSSPMYKIIISIREYNCKIHLDYITYQNMIGFSHFHKTNTRNSSRNCTIHGDGSNLKAREASISHERGLRL